MEQTGLEMNSEQDDNVYAFDKVRAEILKQYNLQDLQAYSTLSKWLHESGIPDHALKVGDTAPDFLLPDVDGRLVSSAELRERGPVVISFFRGDWCPFCTAALRALQTAMPALQSMNAHLLAITPDTRSFPREFQRNNRFGFTILSDVDYGVSLSYGVIFSVPQSYKNYLQEQRVNLSDRHGTKTWMLPIPATFMIDKNSIVRHAFVEPDFTKRDDLQAVFQALKTLSPHRNTGDL